MDTDFASTLIIALASLAGLALLTQAGLKAFLSWVDLQRAAMPVAGGHGASQIGNRIDLADLKERMRRLEAIAAGVDP